MSESIPSTVIEVLQHFPLGLTKKELAEQVGRLLGREVNEKALKLGELGLMGKVKVSTEPREVQVIQQVQVFQAVFTPVAPPAQEPEAQLAEPAEY